MIVALSADSSDAEVQVSSNFGRSRYFVLQDSAREERETVQNPFADSLGDAGIQSARMLIERNIGAVITGGIGKNALKVLSAAEVKVYRCRDKKFTEAVDLFLQGKLEIFFDAGSAEQSRMRKRKRRRLGGSY